MLLLEKISVTSIAGIELLKLVESGKVKLQKFEDLGKINTDLIVGGSVADESSRSIGSRASWSPGVFVRVSARVRIGGVATYDIFVKEGIPTLNVMIDDIDIIPEHLKRGDSVEFLVERLKRPYLEDARVIRGLDGEISQEVARKLSDYDLIEFNQELIELAIARGKHKGTSSDLSIVFIDGSILPGHLDPGIYPGSNYFKGWPPDLEEMILKRKEQILRRFISIYDSVYTSKNVILIGVAKQSADRSLQYMSNIYYDVPDAILLSNILKRGEILGPFRKHRVEKELYEQLDRFSITYTSEKLMVDSYYIMVRENSLPLQIDIVFPKYLEDYDGHNIRNIVLWLLAHPHLSEISEKHTRLSRHGAGVPTLKPIRIIDEKISEKSKGIALLIEKDLARTLHDVLRYLGELALKGVDISLYVYNSQLRGLRRLL